MSSALRGQGRGVPVRERSRVVGEGVARVLRAATGTAVPARRAEDRRALRLPVVHRPGRRRRSDDGPALPSVLLVRSAVACVLAFLLATPLPGTDPPLLAALCGLLGVQVTLTATLRNGLQRVLGVAVGVMLSVAFSGWAGLSWWTLGLVVVLAFLLGQVLRLGPNVVEVPISAMFVLAVNGSAQAAELRLGETLVGVATGVLVNVLLAPPVWVQPAEQAVRAAGEQVSELLLLVALGLRTPGDDDRAQAWLDAARRLDVPIDRADALLQVAHESTRYNVRARTQGLPLQRVQQALGAVERVALHVRGVCRGLVELPRGRLAGAAPERLAEVLEEASEAVPLSVGALLDAPAPDDLGAVLASARAAHDQLGAALVVEGLRDPASFAALGGLLSMLDRVLDDVDVVVPARSRAAA